MAKKSGMKKTNAIWSIIGGVAGLLAIAGVAAGIAVGVRQSKCEHVWDEGTVKVEAACGKEGKLVYKCDECGKKKTEKIAPLEHVEIYYEMKAPTCTDDGWTDGTICEICEEFISAPVTLEALGHNEVFDKGFAADCLHKGWTDGSHCATCEEVIVAQVEIPALRHTLMSIEALAPTCTDDGHEAGKKCETCGTVFATVIPKLGHVDVNEDSKCDNCAKAINATMNMKEVEIEDGELVAGNWYRIYRREDDYKSLFSCEDVNRFSFMSTSKDGNYSQNYIFCSGPLYVLEGMRVIYTDEYVDVYLAEGEYKIVNSDGTGSSAEMISITKDSRFRFMSADPSYKDCVRRLVD